MGKRRVGVVVAGVLMLATAAGRAQDPALLFVGVFANQPLPVGGYWNPMAGQAYTATLTDETGNVVVGHFTKRVSWEWEAKGKVTITEWDDGATFVLKGDGGKEHEVPNGVVKKRIADLALRFTGTLQGNITDWAVTISPPGGASTKPASASNPEGKALLAKVIQAMGGAEKLGSVHAVRLKAAVDAKMPQGEFNIGMERLAAFPDRSWQKLTTPMGDFIIVTTPSAAFMAAPQGTQDLPESQKEEEMKQMRQRYEVLVAQHADDPKYTFTASGTAKVGDVEAQVLDVNADGALVRWYVDPQTSRILRTSAHIVDLAGPADQVLDFSEWKEFGGIPFATKMKITRDGQDGGSLEVEEVEINPTVDAKLFEKPQ